MILRVRCAWGIGIGIVFDQLLVDAKGNYIFDTPYSLKERRRFALGGYITEQPISGGGGDDLPRSE